MKKNSKKVHKIKNTSQSKIEYRGKPSQLKHTQLEAPKIWTNQNQCLFLLKYLTDKGRHNFLHQAGKNSNKDNNNEKQQNINDTKIYYDQAQEIAEKLFQIQCVSKRCIVFFFRHIDEEKLTYNFQEYIDNEEFVEVLYYIQNLLSQKFIQDLILILRSNNNINSIVEILLESKDEPSQYSHIIQNLFIHQQIQTMIEKKYIRPKIEIVRNEFEDFVKDLQTKYLVRNFVVDILNIFQTPITPNESNLDEQFEVAEVNDFNKFYQ